MHQSTSTAAGIVNPHRRTSEQEGLGPNEHARRQEREGFKVKMPFSDTIQERRLKLVAPTESIEGLFGQNYGTET